MWKQIEALRTKAMRAVDRQKALVAAAEADNGRDMNEAEVTEFNTLGDEIEKASTDIERMEKAAKAADRIAAIRIPAAAPAADQTGVVRSVTVPGNTGNDVSVQVNDNLTGQQIVGICAWGVAKNKAYPRRTALEHIADAGFQRIVDMSKATEEAIVKNLITSLGTGNEIVQRAITSLSGGGGDNLVTTPLSTDFIEFLRNESAFLSGNPVKLDMSFGAIDIPGGLVGASATYGLENADIGYTAATTRKINLSAKHISAVTAISNYNIDISPLAIAAIIGDDLGNGVVTGIDAAGLRGDGSSPNPAGILTLVNAAHKFAVASATGVAPTLAQIDSDVKAVLAKARATNISKRRRRWIMSSRVFTYLQFMRDTIAGYVYPGLQAAQPTWYDNIPVTVSEQVPSNLGVGTNESEIYLVDFGHVLMGEARSLRLKSSTEASYKNAGGTLISAFSRDETVIRAMASHDFDLRHDKSCVVLQTVKWGA